MADSVNPQSLPGGFDLYAGYLDGAYENIPAIKARFPGSPVIAIAVFASDVIGDCLDVESFDATPQEAPGWVQARRQAGHGGPLVYCSESVWPAVRQAFSDQNIPEPGYWVAAYPGEGAVIPPGAVGHQWIDRGPYDESVMADYLPGIDPPPPAPPAKGRNNMIARNTTGLGYWCVRETGATYAFEGAPVLGPAPHFLAQWGIGTPTNPVVGVVDDGAGGFMLEADADQYPGVPALYHITADGQYKT